MNGGMAEVQARIATIHTRIQALSPRPAVRPAAISQPADSGAFAQALASEQVQGASVSAADRATGTAPANRVAVPARGGSAVSEQAVIAAAKKYLGVPYKWGGTDPATGGLDCSGFTQRVFKDLGISISRVTQTQVKDGRPVGSMAQARPGDLLFFENGIQPGVDHVGIYLGGGKMIAAPKAGDVVKVQDVYKTPVAIRRVLPEAAASPATTVASPAVGAATKGVGSIPWNKYHDLFEASATRHGVPARFLGAIGTVENAKGDPNAESPAGAIGVMQFMPATARGLGIDPRDPAQAIDGAARHLSRLIRKYGSLDLAAAAYNAGEGAVAKYNGIPPYEETQNYVVKVKKAMEGLR